MKVYENTQIVCSAYCSVIIKFLLFTVQYIKLEDINYNIHWSGLCKKLNQQTHTHRKGHVLQDRQSCVLIHFQLKRCRRYTAIIFMVLPLYNILVNQQITFSAWLLLWIQRSLFSFMLNLKVIVTLTVPSSFSNDSYLWVHDSKFIHVQNNSLQFYPTLSNILTYC